VYVLLLCFKLDINECQTDNGECTQICDNTDGSYQCSCWNGYEMTNDNCTCVGMLIIGVLAVHVTMSVYGCMCVSVCTCVYMCVSLCIDRVAIPLSSLLVTKI